jgi:hypothetical protein
MNLILVLLLNMLLSYHAGVGTNNATSVAPRD